MRSTLHLIAVHVEELPAGRFSWVLTERLDASWSEIARAESAAAT